MFLDHGFSPSLPSRPHVKCAKLGFLWFGDLSPLVVGLLLELRDSVGHLGVLHEVSSPMFQSNQTPTAACCLGFRLIEEICKNFSLESTEYYLQQKFPYILSSCCQISSNNMSSQHHRGGDSHSPPGCKVVTSQIQHDLKWSQKNGCSNLRHDFHVHLIPPVFFEEKLQKVPITFLVQLQRHHLPTVRPFKQLLRA